MQSDAETVAAYLAEVPEARRADMEAMLALVREALPEGYVEAMNWGMICWEVPMEVSGPTYNGRPLMYVALASQKRHMALYLCGANCVPGLKDRLEAAFRAAGRRFDMGAACLRFAGAGDLVPEAVAGVIAAVPVADFVAAARR